MESTSQFKISGLLNRILEPEQPSNMEATSWLKIVTEDDTNEIIKVEKNKNTATKTKSDTTLFKSLARYSS